MTPLRSISRGMVEWFPFWALPLLLLASAAIGLAQPTLRPACSGLVAQPPQGTWASVYALPPVRASMPYNPPPSRRDDGWPRAWQLSTGSVLVFPSGPQKAWAVVETVAGVELQGPVVSACSADVNLDGVCGDAADIEAFFRCMADPKCGFRDFNLDGAVDDGDFADFFRAMGGQSC